MKNGFKVDGFEGIDAVLQNLPKVTAKASVRRAQKKSLQPVADDMNAAAPVGATHGLSRSYVVGTKLNKRQRGQHRRESEVETHVGTNDPAGVQTEFGNEHQAAQPHARPAWNKNKPKVLKTFGDLLWDDVVKTTKRYRKRVAKKGR